MGGAGGKMALPVAQGDIWASDKMGNKMITQFGRIPVSTIRVAPAPYEAMTWRA